jgi:diguanylate cyclase (GGDEF)-like protein
MEDYFMSDNSIAEKEIKLLKKKLDNAINSRAELETDIKSQSSLLIQFIGKLSQVCKGMDITLDNKLANLRSMLKKSVSLADIETQIKSVSVLLQNQSIQNENNINDMHDKFHAAGLVLQKTNGLPAELRRDLRSLLSGAIDKQDALVQYIPLISMLLAFYETALNTKNSPSSGGLLNSAPTISPITASKSDNAELAFIEQFEKILNNLVVSDKHSRDISVIKSQLDDEMSNNKLLQDFIKVFDVIIEDLKDERNTAKVFLSTLSETLTTVQSAVKSTILSTTESQSTHELLNEQLQKQIVDMAAGLNKATSLADIKNDINGKLRLIAGTLEKKTTFEHEQQAHLQHQLSDMTAKVNELESQSKIFEKRIKEQQEKSMQDALTKLGNRASFDDYFTKQIVRFHSKENKLAIVVMDLDDFKRINDTYGHTAGDKTLQVISNTLKKVIGDDAFIARYGGEEFVLIFSDINKELLNEKLNNLRMKIAKLPFKFKNNSVSITMSIGASHVQKNDNVHMAFERSDGALYQAKEKGKNTVIYI